MDPHNQRVLIQVVMALTLGALLGGIAVIIVLLSR